MTKETICESCKHSTPTNTDGDCRYCGEDKSRNTVKLSNNQLKAIVKLINDEIEANNRNGDGAYNTYWDNLKMALGYGIVR